MSLFSLGPTIVYQVQQDAATQTFLTGGIAIYHATTEEITVGTTTIERGGGTRPASTSAPGSPSPSPASRPSPRSRLHVMLAEKSRS